MMERFALLAEVFRYPYPGQIHTLEDLLGDVTGSGVSRAIRTFLNRARSRSLEEREMLYTRTFDLNPLVAPYLGWHIWGEDFKRGAFMAALKQEYRQMGIDLEGELPDHLVPVFRYLSIAASPLPELLEVLVPSLSRMVQSLRSQDPENDYLPVLEATLRDTEHYAHSIPVKNREDSP